MMGGSTMRAECDGRARRPPGRSCWPVAWLVGMSWLVLSTTTLGAADVSIDAARSYKYLQAICRLGPRPSGSRGMQSQQRLLAAHFARFGARVTRQSFDRPDPRNGRAVRMTNLIVTWHPARRTRILLCCHYDTRPFPDLDRVNPRGRFIGANDGGSGVALLMELAHHMKQLETRVGVDFVFFDAEEYLFQRGTETLGQFFHGSTHFATQYRDKPPSHKYVAGVLLDMVGDRDLQIYVEKKSLYYAPRVVDGIWNTARRLKVRAFKERPRPRHDIDDDHVPLNRIAKIPSVDLIDFDYPYWHTTRDNLRACSGKSLAAVGRVMAAWLADLPPGGP